MNESIHEQVQRYYGETLKTNADLKTDACCTGGSVPDYLKPALAGVHPEVAARFYGCGLVAPTDLDGLRVLDLGCGSGHDVYVLSNLVGESGEVVGVDMTDAQLAVAEEYRDWHAEQYGHAQSNVRFLKGDIERLGDLDLEPASFDLIVSNCVINLAEDKAAVLAGAHKLLKPGGELYFSDVYCDRRVPAELREDAVLYGECLSGALYWNDFENLARAAGFGDPRLVEDRPLAVQNPELQARLVGLSFWSATYRLWKLDGLEPACEDYGQAVVYSGSCGEMRDRFVLDKGHAIERGRVFAVCGNTWAMLRDTRLARHFRFVEGSGEHLGLFTGCGGGVPFDDVAVAAGDTGSSGGSCCG